MVWVHIKNRSKPAKTQLAVTASLGQKKGLGHISYPVLDGLSSTVAVEPGYAYQIFKNMAIREFPSGKRALNIKSDYYNVFVVSQIRSDETITGANVKFVLMDVPKYGLPDYNSTLGSLNYMYDELTIEMPVSDFGCEPVFAGSDYYTLEHTKNGNKIHVKLIDFKQGDVFGFNIRIIRKLHLCLWTG